MALAIDITNRRVLSNKVRHDTVKEQQGNAVFAAYFTVKTV